MRLIDTALRVAGHSCAYMANSVAESLWPAPAVNRAHAAAEAFADLEAETEVAEPTVPSQRSLLDAWFRAQTPEVEKQAKDELDRYYPNFADAAASLAETSVREDKQRLEPVDPQPTSTPADPHPANSVDSRGGVDTAPPASPASALTWEGWAVPAILDVLAEHLQIQTKRDEVWCGDIDEPDLRGTHALFSDRSEWAEHVAPLIAQRIACDPARAIAALQSFTK